MSERERLIELMTIRFRELIRDGDWTLDDMIPNVADYLLENDVTIPPFTIGQLIDTVFSHNERVCITVADENDRHYSNSIFKGMGWEIPDTIKELKCKRIYGCIPEHISDSDVLHIEALKGGAE